MSSEGEERIRQILVNNNCEKVDDTLKEILKIIKKYPGLMAGLDNATDQSMQVDEEKIVKPIVTDESRAGPMVKVEEESNCNAEEQEFGDPLFEEVHNIVKVEAPTLSANAQGVATSTNRGVNVAADIPPVQEDVAAVEPPIQEDVAADIPPIQEDVAAVEPPIQEAVAADIPPIQENVRATTRTPEGVLLTLVEGAKVKINWTRCPRTSEAFMECSILNCNYSVSFGTTKDETNEAYRIMKEHIQQMHKDHADELAQADRVAKEKEKQKNFKCPYNPICKLMFADRASRDKHEVVHRTCALCGKKFGPTEFSKNPLLMLSHKCQKSEKRRFTDGEGDQGASKNKKSR